MYVEGSMIEPPTLSVTMASLQLVLLILATTCMNVQAQGNQSATTQSTNQYASVESVTLVRELELKAVDEIMSSAMSLVKSEQAKMAKVKAALAGVKAELTSEMTIKAIVRELKAELTKDHSMAVSELKEMLRKQEERTEDLASDIKTLRKGLSYRLENSERKIEWAITDGSLAPRNTSWVMESFSRIEKQLNQTHEDLGYVKEMMPNYHDCSEIYHGGKRTSDVYTIYLQGGAGVKVYCDMVTDGGGWTVFHQRYNGEVDFNRRWEEYARGFGDPNLDYWLGLHHVHALTQAQPTVLYVGVTDFQVGAKYAKYGIFKVSSEAEKFSLTVGSYSGTAGDSMTHHNGMKFSTKDQDNDVDVRSCSEIVKGGWWFKNCYHAYLNGQWSSTEHKRVWDKNYWLAIRGEYLSVKDLFMMLRPASFKP